MNDEPSYQDIVRAERRAVAVRIGLVGLVLLLVMAASVHRPLLAHLGGWLHGDHDLLGRSSWSAPALPADPGAVAGLDLLRVHAELIPTWFIALANDDPAGSRVDHAFRELRSGVAADPQLLAIVVQLHALVLEDPWANAERIFALGEAWNQHLHALGQPWHLESNVVDLGQGPFFYTKSYRIEADLIVPIEGAELPLKVLRRVDSTNVRESYLGMVAEGDERALVMVDRVRDFALDELWQLLDPDLDPDLSEREAAFAPLVRAEVASALEPAHVQALRATARPRWNLHTVAMAINLRQACGSTLVVNHVPWQGMDKGELDSLERLAHADAQRPCPAITLEELDRVKAATTAIRGSVVLEPALEALVAFAARATAVHELRHVADTRAHGAERIPCVGCEDLPDASVREASAYLASLAWSDARATALLQACGQRSGSHAWAMGWISDELDRACEHPPPRIGAVAAALEAEAFGSRGAIVLPTGWPESLPVR
jgi:hypothetical protein